MAGGNRLPAAIRERVRATAAEPGWPARSLAWRRTRIAGLLFPGRGQSADVNQEPPLHVIQ
jgi:DNA-binding LacI/PurR family transcriptional regulator